MHDIQTGLKKLRDLSFTDTAAYGSKAAVLGQPIRGGLPVPGGCALPADLLAAYMEFNRIAFREKDLILKNGRLQKSTSMA